MILDNELSSVARAAKIDRGTEQQTRSSDDDAQARRMRKDSLRLSFAASCSMNMILPHIMQLERFPLEALDSRW
jgi:hypothetical protein